MCTLIQKYNVPGPRYTSYPTVPYWDLENFSGKLWKSTVTKVYNENREEGISLYIHLPFCESMCTFCGCHKRITKRHDLEIPYINGRRISIGAEMVNLGDLEPFRRDIRD